MNSIKRVDNLYGKSSRGRKYTGIFSTNYYRVSNTRRIILNFPMCNTVPKYEVYIFKIGYKQKC